MGITIDRSIEVMEYLKTQNPQLESLDVAISTMRKYQKIEQPSVTPQEPRWIPVSERLPEDSGEYLVSVIDKDYKAVGVAWFAHLKDNNIKEDEWRDLMTGEKVIAWMPLPEPYKTDRSEEE